MILDLNPCFSYYYYYVKLIQNQLKKQLSFFYI